jgi:hypothetical protein
MNKNDLTPRQLGCVIAIILAVIIGGTVIVINSEYHPSPPDEVTIYDASKDIVKKFLVAPTTAKFPNHNESGVGASLLSNNVWRVWGYVDSQNSFAAMIRSDWEIIVEANGQRVKAKELSIAGQQVYRSN